MCDRENIPVGLLRVTFTKGRDFRLEPVPAKLVIRCFGLMLWLGVLVGLRGFIEGAVVGLARFVNKTNNANQREY